MSVLKTYFDKKIDQRSPVQTDKMRVVNYDEDGNEFITFEDVDYAKIQEANGTAELWSLNALLKAGINPNFPIHTGNNTRLDGIDVIEKAGVIADELLAGIESEKNNDVKE